MSEAHTPFVPQAAGGPAAWKIREAESNLEAVKRDYLKRWGWETSSSNPGAYWLWKRDFADYDERMAKVYEERKLPGKHRPYGVMNVPMDLAISMTLSSLDEQLEIGDDDD